MKIEFIRKFIVSLKRRPHNIALFVLVISFLVYSLNTGYISDTSALLQGSNMGLAGFVTMLASILIFVIFLNAFPKRQKPKVIMLVILYVMFAIMVFCDIYYGTTIDKMLNAATRDLTEGNPFVRKSQHIVYVHAILVGVDAVLVATIPVYGKLLRKIKTSVDVEDNGEMGAIDISEE